MLADYSIHKKTTHRHENGGGMIMDLIYRIKHKDKTTATATTTSTYGAHKLGLVNTYVRVRDRSLVYSLSTYEI